MILIVLFLVLAIGATACDSGIGATPAPSATLVPSATPGEVTVLTTSAPDSKTAARRYLDAWVAEDYPAMYAMLTPLSQDALTEADFTTYYRNIAAEAALHDWQYEILTALTNPRTAQVGYRVSLNSVLVGTITRETQMNLSLEDGAWRVQWDEALILPELKGGNTLKMEYRTPARANIYARNGMALVAQADAVAIGLDTSKVNEESQNSLLSLIQEITNIPRETLDPQVDNYRSFGWYLPVADVSAEVFAQYERRLMNYDGVLATGFQSRYYFDGGLAPHLVGYVSAIQQEEIEEYKRLGYNVWSDRVGQAGLELWGEQYLSGKRGGVLYLYGPDNQIITRLAETNPEPSQAIYTTLDMDLQRTLQERKALSDGFRGAIVVMERDTGRVLAMLSSPSYNPNLFEPTNVNYAYQINDLFDQNTRPLFNRTTRGQYPLGSVFKVITFSAALESELYTADSEYTCGYFFDELSGVRLNDWTYEHYLEDGETQPSGILTLPQGLMRSCNPWFWHIGLDLFNRNMLTAVSDMARGFGLGKVTGIQLDEDPGNIADAGSALDATNNAIGQGTTLVTPLQVASFIAAIGNGGTLYTPSVVERIVPPVGEPTYVFTSTISGQLPVSPENLKILQDAMVSVVKNPRGTAYYVLNAFSNSSGIPIAGKTGTAQSGAPDPHAWFAGYTFANRADKPDIAVVVLVEYGGEGSEVAAPIFRRVLEAYYGLNSARYPWEERIGVVSTPTPEPTQTPIAESTQTPEP
mgnify:CR=1 FL=1